MVVVRQFSLGAISRIHPITGIRCGCARVPAGDPARAFWCARGRCVPGAGFSGEVMALVSWLVAAGHRIGTLRVASPLVVCAIRDVHERPHRRGCRGKCAGSRSPAGLNAGLVVYECFPVRS